MDQPFAEVPITLPAGGRFLPYKDTGLYAITDLDNASFGFAERTDLVPGVNEGGLRIWECTKDLISHLSANEALVRGKRVLELGCGHGLVGTKCLLLGAREVVFQDYNGEVLSRVTMANVQKNAGNLSSARFISGPWQDYSHLGAFDLVLTSETTYNPANYPSLLLAIKSVLRGDCLVACKTVYFGVGGATELFLASAQSFGFVPSLLHHYADGKSTLRDLLLLQIPPIS